MSQRTQFTVQLINDSNGQPVANIPVTVTDRTSGAIIAPFVDETSQIYTANLQTDANGLAQGWVPLGGYLATATSAFLSVPYAVAFDSVPWTTVSGGVTTSVSGGLQPLTVVAAITSSVTLTAGQLTPVNAAGTSLTETLPTGKPAGTLLAVEKVDSSANTVTVTGSMQGSNTSIILKLINEMVTFQTDSAGSWWPIGGRLPLSGLDARYDAAGAATTALSSAQTFATSAVGVETSRAEAAEALLAPLDSPVLTGSPQAPNPVFGDNSTNIATTNWVKQVASGVAGVSSVFTRAGAIVAVSGDYSAAQVTNAATQSFVSGAITSAVSTETTRATTAEALLAPLASPTLTGTPTAPTPSVNDNSTTLATTSFVKLIASGVGGVSSVFTRVGPVVANTGDYTVSQVTGAAPTVNPTFSGIASAPLFATTGVPGGTSSGRNVGTTVSGSPSVGIYKQGDFAHDLSGNVWTCIVAGSPGQWAGNLANVQVNSAPVLVANTYPTVSGAYIQGQALTDISPATWLYTPTGYNYQWQRCSASGTNCANIGGATSQAYTLQAADVNSTIRVGETAVNANGTATSTAYSLTGQTVAASGAAPQNLTLPVVTGTPTVGQTLITSAGIWNNTPTQFGFAWQAGGTTVSGATGQTLLLVSGMANFTINSRVTAANTIGSGIATSLPVGPVQSVSVPVNTVLPLIAGIPTQGNVLTASPGTWTPTNPSPTFTYQWIRAGVAAPTFVQNWAAGNSSSTTPTVLVNGVSAGHQLVLVVTSKDSTNGPVVSSITASGTWVQVPNNTNLGFFGTLDAEMWWTANSTAGTYNVTPNITAAGAGIVANSVGVWIGEFSGLSTIDVYNSARGNTQIATGPSLTAGAQNELSFYFGSMTSVPTATPGNGYTNYTGPQAFSTNVNPVAFKILPGATTEAPAWTQTSAGQWVVIGAMFRPAGVSGGSNIAAATNSQYTIQGADVGSQLLTRVTGTNVAGSGVAYTANTATVAALGGNAQISTFTDVFAGSSLGSQWQINNGSPTVSNDEVALPCITGNTVIVSQGAYDLTGTNCYASFVPPAVGTGTKYTTLQLDTSKTGSNQNIQWWSNGTNCTPAIQQGGAQVNGPSVTYSSTGTQYFRIRESGGTLYWDYSADSITWTQQWSQTYSLTISALYVTLISGYFGTESASTSFFLSVNASNAGTITPPTTYPAAPTGSAYKSVVYFDDFAGSSLDTASWTYGFTDLSNLNTGNVGGYNDTQFNSQFNKSAVSVASSMLTFTCTYNTTTTHYTTGMVATAGPNINYSTANSEIANTSATWGKLAWDHGTWAAKIQLPNANRHWTGFWNMPITYPGHWIENDIVEVLTGNPNSTTYQYAQQTAHDVNTISGGESGFGISTSTQLSTTFNRYSGQVDGSGNVKYWFNDTVTGTVSAGTDFVVPWYIIVNDAVGGRWFVSGSPGPNPNQHPSYMYTDWCIVYQ